MLLQFTGTFNLETHQTCGYDYLTMTDGDGSTLMGKTCGTSLPNNITSASNVIEMEFRTDGSQPREGWSLSWRAVLPGERGLEGEEMSRINNYQSAFYSQKEKLNILVEMLEISIG